MGCCSSHAQTWPCACANSSRSTGSDPRTWRQSGDSRSPSCCSRPAAGRSQ
uniref:Uncharacterized protein n=1 Tax=Arundo donax TaxID=35708 RepID=A0A0A8YIS3_ARUDO